MAASIENARLYHSVAKAKTAREATFDAMGEAVSVQDLSFNILRVNESMVKMSGLTPRELVGKKCYEAVHGRCEPIPACRAAEVMRTGKTASAEIWKKATGLTLRVTVNPITDSEGKVMGLVHAMRDITERKQLLEQLLQSENMSAVGQLVSGVAHELNNLLTDVLGYSQLLLRQCDAARKKEIGSDLEAIVSEAQRASRIVQNLLSFARTHETRKAMVDINKAIRTVIERRSYELNVSNIKVDTEPDPELPRTMADLHQLEQVLLNIINNAEQSITAAGEPGFIRIATSSHDGSVEIRISDNGAGMFANAMQRIIEPFFTTKDVGKGTGLGLSICYGIIQDHGGNISMQSNPGQGASFLIELPMVEHEARGSANRGAVVKAGGSGRRVLLVDDEPAIVELLTDILTMDGHGVDVARNADLALKKAGQSPV